MILFRPAVSDDIPRMMEIRFAVQENRLADPCSVTPADCDRFVDAGQMWVAERQGRILGFSASDERDGTIWALFVDPPEQGAGLGVPLLKLACDALTRHGFGTARLTTDPGTRADRFYRRQGWVDCGLAADGEQRFEISL